MRLGFTGTRRGMTAAQRAACAELLARLTPEVVHHGDAVGADAEMHGLASAAGVPVVVHPPVNPSHRAFCQGGEVLEPRPHKARDRDVVDDTDLLLGTPGALEEQDPHSGTWYTIRYAKRSGRPIIIVWPDGREERLGFAADGR